MSQSGKPVLINDDEFYMPQVSHANKIVFIDYDDEVIQVDEDLGTLWG